MGYQRDSEVVSLSELPDFKDGPNYLALEVDTATVWYYHANLMPLLRDMELTKGVPVTRRYESRTGSPTKPPIQSIPCLCRASSTLRSWAQRTSSPRPWMGYRRPAEV